LLYTYNNKFSYYFVTSILKFFGFDITEDLRHYNAGSTIGIKENIININYNSKIKKNTKYKYKYYIKKHVLCIYIYIYINI